MSYDASAEYMSGFLDGIIKMALSSCRNADGYEMSAFAEEDEETLIKRFSEKLGRADLDGSTDIELLPCEKGFSEMLRSRFGTDRKSRRAIAGLEDMLVSEFGDEEGIYIFKNDREIKEAFSGYSGGKAPFYIVTQLFVSVFERAAVLFMIGSDE